MRDVRSSNYFEQMKGRGTRTLGYDVIDDINIDNLKHAGWDQQAKQNAENTIADFRSFMESHKDEIAALSIFTISLTTEGKSPMK